MQTLQFSSISPSNHLMSIRVTNTDLSGQEFNSRGNILNKFKRKETKKNNEMEKGDLKRPTEHPNKVASE